jgi:hypothetical protein
MNGGEDDSGYRNRHTRAVDDGRPNTATVRWTCVTTRWQQSGRCPQRLAEHVVLRAICGHLRSTTKARWVGFREKATQVVGLAQRYDGTCDDALAAGGLLPTAPGRTAWAQRAIVGTFAVAVLYSTMNGRQTHTS